MLKKLLTLITFIIISYNSFGQNVSAGRDHSIFLCSDGSVRTCGSNSSGKLGHGDIFDKKLPKIVSGLTNVIAVSAGGEHSLFLKSDGTVWACGLNIKGQIGPSNIQSEIPIQISGLSGITKISAGFEHSLFLKNDGTVWACGSNSNGELGDGTNTNKNTPFQVNGLTGITSISAGTSHSLFLKNDGTVWGCGDNFSGQLGDGTNINKNTPVQINGLLNIIEISAGESYSLFLKSNNTVVGCGYNLLGQLGNGDTGDSKTPVEVEGLTGVKAISAGSNHSLFLKNDSTVMACGRNYNGTLGEFPYMYSSLNVFQVSLLTGITSIDASNLQSSSLFVKNDGTIWACGENSFGLLGDGTTTDKSTAVSIGNVCLQPTPPQVNFSNFPTSLCVGSTINIEPNITGSLPDIGLSVDNSINVTAPKNIARNSHLVFVLDGNDKIMSYDFDGNLQNTYNANSSITGLTTFAPDESDNVWVHNAATKRLVRLGPGGVNDTSSIGSFMLSSAGDPKFTDMAFTDGPIVENLILADTSYNTPDLMNGIDVSNTNPNSNYTWGLSDSIITKFPPNQHLITSIAFDNKLYAERRMLFADPQHNTLWQRKFFTGNWFGSAKPLIDTAITSGLAFDFIDTDTVASWGGDGGSPITVSSSTKNIVGVIWTQVSLNGEVSSYLDTIFLSSVNTQIPIGMVSATNGNMPQYWIADKGLNKLLRVQLISYRLTPTLPAGLKFNTITGKVEGTPTSVLAPQTYQLIVSNGLGSDTSYFTFGVTPTGPLSNSAGTSNATGNVNDGLTIKYYEPNNCGRLIEIADSIGGTSPGQTQISQTVYPLVSVIAKDSLIRRVNSMRADNQDVLKLNVTFYYSYQDIQAFNITRGSNLLSNDTIGKTMQMAVLQMHDKPNGSKEPIIHSPITAKWSTANQQWEATVPVTKFSEFYGSDIGTLTTFNCTNTGKDSVVTANNYYVWNNDSIFTSGTYNDTLINLTGCDSVVTLKLTLNTVGIAITPELEKGIAIYPNPSNGVLNVVNNNPNAAIQTIKVVNVLGEEVLSIVEPNKNTQLDLSNNQKGIYFITISSQYESITKKIVVK